MNTAQFWKGGWSLVCVTVSFTSCQFRQENYGNFGDLYAYEIEDSLALMEAESYGDDYTVVDSIGFYDFVSVPTESHTSIFDDDDDGVQDTWEDQTEENPVRQSVSAQESSSYPSVSHANLYGRQRTGSVFYASGNVPLEFDFYYDNNDNTYSIRRPITEPVDYNHPNVVYRLTRTTDSEFIFQRFFFNVVGDYNQFMAGGSPIRTVYSQSEGEIRVAKDWNAIHYNGQMYDKEIPEAAYRQYQHNLQLITARAMTDNPSLVDNSSSVLDEIKAEIDEIDRKQAARTRQEQNTTQTRSELSRGHRIIRYKSTNTSATPKVWCAVCNRDDYPHDHVLNDGRH